MEAAPVPGREQGGRLTRGKTKFTGVFPKSSKLHGTYIAGSNKENNIGTHADQHGHV